MTTPPAVLLVGDVHGQVPRLQRALSQYDPSLWTTVFLGDLVDGGDFGVGALRLARDRPNSEVLLGNHEILMLGALAEYPRSGPATAFWAGVGGRPHDLRELASDPELAAWLRQRPAMLRLPDGTVAQHCDSDSLGRFADRSAPDVIESVNQGVRTLIDAGEWGLLWDAMTSHGIFERQPGRLAAWLSATGARRVAHGHHPMSGAIPRIYGNGLALGYCPARGRVAAAPLPLD